jgi:hypothetical protein
MFAHRTVNCGSGSRSGYCRILRSSQRTVRTGRIRKYSFLIKSSLREPHHRFYKSKRNEGRIPRVLANDYYIVHLLSLLRVGQHDRPFVICDCFPTFFDNFTKSTNSYSQHDAIAISQSISTLAPSVRVSAHCRRRRRLARQRDRSSVVIRPSLFNRDRTAAVVTVPLRHSYQRTCRNRTRNRNNQPRQYLHSDSAKCQQQQYRHHSINTIAPLPNHVGRTRNGRLGLAPRR